MFNMPGWDALHGVGGSPAITQMSNDKAPLKQSTEVEARRKAVSMRYFKTRFDGLMD